MNEARMRMTRVPAGAELVLNKVSAAPGFWIGNVIVMAGVPHIMQTMLEYVDAEAEDRRPECFLNSVRADAREGDIGTELGEIAKQHPDVVIGSYPFMDEKIGGNTNVVVRSRDPQKLAAAKAGRGGHAATGEGRACRRQAIASAISSNEGRHAGDGTGNSGEAAAPAEQASPKQPEKMFPVSWDQFHRDSRALAWRLSSAGPFEAVVCVTRGGLVPAGDRGARTRASGSSRPYASRATATPPRAN